MPAFHACLICNKTGIINHNGRAVICPVCGPTARKTYKVDPKINQAGWTTLEAIKNYLRNQACKDVESKIADQLVIYKATNPGASNSQIKKYTRSLNSVQLMDERTKELFAQYKVKDDE